MDELADTQRKSPKNQRAAHAIDNSACCMWYVVAKWSPHANLVVPAAAVSSSPSFRSPRTTPPLCTWAISPRTWLKPPSSKSSARWVVGVISSTIDTPCRPVDVLRKKATQPSSANSGGGDGMHSLRLLSSRGVLVGMGMRSSKGLCWRSVLLFFARATVVGFSVQAAWPAAVKLTRTSRLQAIRSTRCSLACICHHKHVKAWVVGFASCF